MLFNVQTSFNCVIFKSIVNIFTPLSLISKKINEKNRFKTYHVPQTYNSCSVFFNEYKNYDSYGSHTLALLFIYPEPEIKLQIVRGRQICICAYEEMHRRMFFTFGEVRKHRLSPLSLLLFNDVAAFKSHALTVAFSAAQLLNGTYQTGEYVLM